MAHRLLQSVDAVAQHRPTTHADQMSGLQPEGVVLLHGFADNGDNDSRIVKLKGLPYHVSKQEVVEFFSGLEVIFVHFVYESSGRPSGLAFVEFKSRAVAAKALKKRGHYLHKRYIKILQVSYEEMKEQVLLGTAAIPTSRYQPWSTGAFPPGPSSMHAPIPSLSGQGAGCPQMLLPPPARMNAPQLGLLPPPPPPFAHRAPAAAPVGNSMHQLIVNFDGDVVTTSTSSFRNLLASGSTVYVSGLRSHTTTIVQDVTQLFSAFRLDLPSMVYGVDQAGLPSGEVWLRFRSVQDAQLACNAMHGQVFKGSVISVMLVTPK